MPLTLFAQNFRHFTRKSNSWREKHNNFKPKSKAKRIRKSREVSKVNFNLLSRNSVIFAKEFSSLSLRMRTATQRNFLVLSHLTESRNEQSEIFENYKKTLSINLCKIRIVLTILNK